MKLFITPVTSENRAAAERLRVFPEQNGFIETVQECMEEADALPAWHPVVIETEEGMVGFSMFGRIAEPKYTRVWFDRLLIDRSFQHRGYGREAIHVILREMMARYPGEPIYLSVYDDNPHAIALYQSIGFRFTGELDTKGEKIMVLDTEKNR